MKKNILKEAFQEVSFWLKELLGSLFNFLLAPILCAGMGGLLVENVFGWSTDLTMIVVAIILIAATVNTGSSLVDDARGFYSALHRCCSSVRTVKNASKKTMHESA